MDFTTFKGAVIEAAKKQGIEEYELYFQTAESTTVSAFKHEINEFSSSVDGGVCFRCIVDGKMGYASTKDLSAASAEELVGRAASNAASLENDEKEFLGEGGKEYEPLEVEVYELPSTDKLVATVLEGQDALYAANPAVIDGSSTRAGVSKRTTAIFNSKGLDLSFESSSANVMMSSVVRKDGEVANDYNADNGNFAELNIKEIADKAVEKAMNKLGAQVAPTGAYPVVFSPEAMGMMLSTFSGFFSSETALRGLTKFRGQEGQKIAADIVTLIDDPFYKDGSPINFDAEGSPAHKKTIIENGVLKTLLYNLKTAHAFGVETTGNASKASYDAPVSVRPFTMYLQPGELTEEELLKKAGNGVYITSLGGMHAGANPISGDFSLQSSGFMIENGVKTTPVASFTVAGNFYSLLGQITAIANEIKLPGMRFGGAFGSPAVLVEGLSIAGK